MYKGYSLPKETEEHLVAFGLTNALYTIRAQDLKPDHFGKLMLCPFHVRGFTCYSVREFGHVLLFSFGKI